ncbi:MAG: FtsX-like permease family protein [Lachnospiraceae bacterium]
MSMMRLAFLNFKSSFRNYLSLIISLAFTILVFLNFQNLIYSDTFSVLGQRNKEYINILIQVISIVLICFMFFFIWYSTNVFLTGRKKEIGIYIFMGLTNQKIGKLYAIETTLIGLSALAAGIVTGLITSWLFQMVLLALSDIAVDINFRITWQPVLFAAVVYLIIYLLFVLKGYINIIRSSVLEMVSASRKNEFVHWKSSMLIIKTLLGVAVTCAGYYMAVKDGGQEVMGNVLIAVVLVIAGTYLLFGGLIPFIFQNLVKHKKILYCKERSLWMNNMVFRIRKNYRTYAMVCILMLCSVTALATGFAMRTRYDNMTRFRSTYTFQALSTRNDLDPLLKQQIEQSSELKYSSQIPLLVLDSSMFETKFQNTERGIVSWADIKKTAEGTGLKFELKEPADNEIIELRHIYLLSFITDRSGITVTINSKEYQQIDDCNEAYLGYFQEDMSLYVVNEREYKRLLPLGQEIYTFNYRIQDMTQYENIRKDLNALAESEEQGTTGIVSIDPDNSDIEWIRVLYSICIFMFMVFILSSGSILFMKLYNDAFEEKDRYQVLEKLGFDRKTLKRAAAHELFVAYAAPFLLMAISSYFSVHALAKMMFTSLFTTWLTSIAVILAFFLICYLLSVSIYCYTVFL